MPQICLDDLCDYMLVIATIEDANFIQMEAVNTGSETVKNEADFFDSATASIYVGISG